MKKVLLLSLSLFFLTSCNKQQQKTKEVKKSSTKEVKQSNTFSYDLLKVVEVDGCEYVVYKKGYSGNITHKGNCKYCTERNKTK